MPTTSFDVCASIRERVELNANSDEKIVVEIQKRGEGVLLLLGEEEEEEAKRKAS